MHVVGTDRDTPFHQGDRGLCILDCSGLMTAILNDGLEEIGERAFSECGLLCINIPPSIRAIKSGAFESCSQLATTILNNGLEEIGENAFYGSALVSIDIPPLRQGDQGFRI